MNFIAAEGTLEIAPTIGYADLVADLTYHVLVLMVAKGLSPDDVSRELEKRHN